VRLLLDNGADINAKVNGAYSTALQAATSRGSESVVRLLLERGADVRSEGKVYKSTLSLALEQGHECIAQLLRIKGAMVPGFLSTHKLQTIQHLLHTASTFAEQFNASYSTNHQQSVLGPGSFIQVSHP
jgi:hypothetical protein